MDFKALFLSIVGAAVAVFFALESFLFFQANGIAVPLFVKMLLCAIGIYVFWRNVRRIRRPRSDESSTNAA